jgi:formate dehydrogenase major subunit
LREALIPQRETRLKIETSAQVQQERTMLRKKTNGVARGPRNASILSQAAETSLDRRTFLRGSGLAIGGLGALAATGGTVTRAAAAAPGQGKVEIRKSVCTHCSVGCTVLAEVQDSVWTGQGPGCDSRFSLGDR